jgi:hypothetical protein
MKCCLHSAARAHAAAGLTEMQFLLEGSDVAFCYVPLHKFMRSTKLNLWAIYGPGVLLHYTTINLLALNKFKNNNKKE